MDILEKDELMAEVLGPIWREFINVKRSEARKYARMVTDWERRFISQRF